MYQKSGLGFAKVLLWLCVNSSCEDINFILENFELLSCLCYINVYNGGINGEIV
jgi:hypothetical protein